MAVKGCYWYQFYCIPRVTVPWGWPPLTPIRNHLYSPTTSHTNRTSTFCLMVGCDSCWPCDYLWHQQLLSSLVQVMAGHLLGPSHFLIHCLSIVIWPSWTNWLQWNLEKKIHLYKLFFQQYIFEKFHLQNGSHCVQALTHLPLDKMAAILQTTFSSALFMNEKFCVWFKFHWSLFLKAQLTIIQDWFW